KDLAMVGDASQFIVRAKVDELEIQGVHLKQPVHIRADAFPSQILDGRVSSIASSAERDSFAKVEVLIDVVNSAKLPLKHNLSVRAQIITDTIPNAIGIPIKYVQRKIKDRAWVTVKRGVFIR